MRAFLNPAVQRTAGFRGLFDDEEYEDVRAFYATRPALQASPLRALPSLTAASGIGRIEAKDETQRFDLNAFKILGVRYAVHRLSAAARRRGYVCATAGNHGRAVARAARDEGVPCTVFIPAAREPAPAEQRTRSVRIGAIREEGADIVEVDGTYEDAVRAAASFGTTAGATIISDTSWDGYDEIPRRIMAGYTWLFEEAQAQWSIRPDVVVVQAGVGGLVCAAASWFARRFGPMRPFVIACEPENAACLLESARSGRATRLSGSLDTIMAGLRCAAPSPAAWPAIAAGVDAFVTVTDQEASAAMDALERAPDEERIVAGPSGACGAAALLAVCSHPEMASVRRLCGLDRSTRALIVITEGA